MWICKWEETQENLHLTLQRNIYGLHAPIRQLMERQIVSQVRFSPSYPVCSTVLTMERAQTPIPTAFGGFIQPSNLQLDILLGRDETINISDVLTDSVVTAEVGDFHSAMEKKLRML